MKEEEGGLETSCNQQILILFKKKKRVKCLNGTAHYEKPHQFTPVQLRSLERPRSSSICILSPLTNGRVLSSPNATAFLSGGRGGMSLSVSKPQSLLLSNKQTPQPLPTSPSRKVVMLN